MIATPSSSAATMSNEQIVRFRDPVRHFVGARVRDDALADDLTQEIFVRVLRRLPEVKDPRRVAGWIFQIARNLVADHFRRSRATAPVRETDLSEDSDHESVGAAEEERLRAELTAYVRDVVKANTQLTAAAVKVTRAMDEQAAGAGQLAKSASRMRALTQQTSTAVQEQTRALGRSATSARDVASNVQRGVQGLAGSAAGIRLRRLAGKVGVRFLAAQVMADFREMNANLVGAAGFQPAFEDGVTGKLFQRTNVGYGPLGL